jgi:hypothetical protein
MNQLLKLVLGRENTPMPDSEASPMQEPTRKASLPWWGSIAFILLGVVGSLGPDITPSRKLPDLTYYIPRYVLLALSIGFGLGAVRSVQRVDRIFGIAVLVVGSGMVAYIIRECWSIMGR